MATISVLWTWILALVDHMKRIASPVCVVVAALLGGCAAYPDGNGYGGGYSGDEYYDGYATGVPVVPQTNVYMGYGNYSSPGYYDGWGRYYGPGPGYRGYHDRDRDRPNNGNRGDNGGSHGQPNGGSHGGTPPQGAAAGPGGPSGSNAPHPGAGNSPPQQAGNGAGHGSSNETQVKALPARQPRGNSDH